jgi:two-component system OmpR family sensor kinase
MLRLSLRARLLAGLGAVVVALVVVAFVVTSTTRAYLVGQLDERLLMSADRFGDGRRPDPGGGGFPAGGELPGVDRPAPPDFYAATLLPDGTVVVHADEGLSGEALPPPDVDVATAEDHARSGDPFTAGSVDSDVRYRVRATADEATGGFELTALPLTDVDDTIGQLVLAEVLATSLIVALLAAVGWWVLRLGIRPIKQMTDAAQQIAAGDRSHRVPELAPSTEAGQLGGALNHMLDELDRSFAQQAASEDRLRRFVADASHELRTPVTTIRGYAELYRIGGLPPGDGLDEAMRRTEQEAVRMARLVDDLLTLAKLDQGRPLERRPVDLAVLAADAARDAGAVDGGRRITTELPASGHAVVDGDEDRLRQVIANVVGNALVHTPPGTPIELRVESSGDRARLAVADHGPGMPADVASRVTQRFYRADPARARHKGGSGLGMSIADAAVAAHGGAITIDSVEGAGTTVTVTLPLAAGARA